MEKDICVLQFDKKKGYSHVVSDSLNINLKRIPRVGEYLVYGEKENCYISKVVEVHYSADGGADVFIGEKKQYDSYKKALDVRLAELYDEK